MCMYTVDFQFVDAPVSARCCSRPPAYKITTFINTLLFNYVHNLTEMTGEIIIIFWGSNQCKKGHILRIFM